MRAGLARGYPKGETELCGTKRDTGDLFEGLVPVGGEFEASGKDQRGQVFRARHNSRHLEYNECKMAVPHHISSAYIRVRSRALAKELTSHL